MSRAKCEHGRQRSKCKECKALGTGGIGVCEHGRTRSHCKVCGGGSICNHNRIRYTCKDCGGSQICEHNRRRQDCRECGGSLFCEHDKRRSYCKACKGSSFCKHERVRASCSICNPVVSFNRYRIAAIRRSLLFTITLDDFQWITTPPCIFCGEANEPRGIDRWNNLIGYEFENCNPCCGPCNYMKGKLDGQTFINRCARVAARQGQGNAK